MYISITDKCNSCGICSAINSEIFDIVNGFATVRLDYIEDYEDDCIDAVLACPMNAIKITEF